jgi:hypothetical protein
MSIRTLDRVHHLFLILLSAVAAALLYRFATILIEGLPWPSWLPL